MSEDTTTQNQKKILLHAAIPVLIIQIKVRSEKLSHLTTLHFSKPANTASAPSLLAIHRRITFATIEVQ
jgi:hypothetical protein